MFTGIIEDIGTLTKVLPRGSGARLTISCKLPLEQVRLGDSIAVTGACLTVVHIGTGSFDAEISRETAERSTLARIRPGSKLHLERAMRLVDRLDGHLVSGHIDGVGRILRRNEQGDSIRLEISAPDNVFRYLVEKGSVAVHGVSLTVNEMMPGGAFSVTIVPFTAQRTFLADLGGGAEVNLEADLLGKYVERLLGGREQKKNEGLTLEQLARQGFLG